MERELAAAMVAEPLVVETVAATVAVGGEVERAEVAVASVGGEEEEVDAVGIAQAVVHACKQG